ncbi:MAG: XRE family transcriptional regulator [Zoogloea sp.]|nr:XRE family transcriptional regulator [Zoogloea sp.]
MKKAYMGVRLKRLREERGLTQVALARALELSPSYLNQLEQNQRPLTVPVLLKLNAVFGVDVQLFSEDDEARLIADLREILADFPGQSPVSLAEIRELAANMPAAGRVVVALHRRYRESVERTEALSARLGGEDAGPGAWRPMAYEEVRDFFYARHNHVAELDELAERLFAEWNLKVGDLAGQLAARLADRHGVRIVRPAPGDTAEPAEEGLRSFDPEHKVLYLSPHLKPGQHAFQMATQLAFLEAGELIRKLAEAGGLSGEEARRLARIGLANYFAGALLLPYGRFLAAAEQLRYDIDRLGRQFGVGFETVCHRLSTLQRPGARGIPFFFVRVDRAGNISKRQSATDFHFSRVGGTCPLWNVYEAFAQPGRILTQLARMPDGRTYLWMARTVSRGYGGYGAPSKTFAIGLGCDVRHAAQLVYAKGLDLADPEAATPIGAGCKVCEREHCPQRAFPPIGRPLAVDEQRSEFTPYPVVAR